MQSSAKKLWDRIRNPDCTDCDLHKEAQSVCLIGDGPVPCNVMIVGEAPGYREDDVGKPFAGRAGKLLDETLNSVGLSRDDIFITNSAKCRPPDNRTPTRTEFKACRPYLEGELKYVRPKFILVVGNGGLSLLKKSGILRHRGEIYDFNGAKVLPTVHPAAVLRNPQYDTIWRADVASFARLVRGESGAVPPKVYLVTSKRMLITTIKAIFASEAVAYDVETSSYYDYEEGAKIASIGIAPKPGIAFVVPIHHPQARWGDAERVLRTIGHALMYTRAKIIAHNAKFDDRWLHRFGIPISTDFDTMIAAHLLEENRLKGLKPLAQMILGADPWKDVDLSSGGAMKTELSKLARYNAKDADYTLRLYYWLKEELKKPENRRTLRLFTKLVMPASRTLTYVELNGIWIDRERLETRTAEVSRKLEGIDEELSELAGVRANWNSTKQLGEVMFNRLDLPVLDITKGGKPSTKESVLLQLRKTHPFAEKLLEWRQWTKYKSTYLDNWREQLDSGGRIHPNYKVTGTVTGRLSSGKEEGQRGRGLNVQQVPRNPYIRGILGAPAGWLFVEADFSQIELRVAAHYSGDSNMLRSFRRGDDIHLATAVSVTGKPPKAITSEERKKAKSVNFGFLYGMGPKKYVMYAEEKYELEIPLSEARSVRRRFFETYPSLIPWHERQRRLARNYQRVQSAIGRIRHLPDIQSGDKEVRAEAERQAINSPVQSLASDLMLLSMVLIHPQMKPEEASIVGSIHDSILFEIKEEKVDHYVKLIRRTMENLPLKKKFGLDLQVPIKVDIKIGRHWGEGEEK